MIPCTVRCDRTEGPQKVGFMDVSTCRRTTEDGRYLKSKGPVPSVNSMLSPLVPEEERGRLTANDI